MRELRQVLEAAKASRLTPAIRIALDTRARLIGPGPVPGSYVVRGDRDRLARAMLPAGILVLAGPATGCGETA